MLFSTFSNKHYRYPRQNGITLRNRNPPLRPGHRPNRTFVRPGDASEDGSRCAEPA